MRLEQLYHVVAVAQTGSISMAAERNYISQPALSSSISKLELELGVPLFKRSNSGVQPTDIGETVIQKALRTIELLEEIKGIAEESNRMLTGDIHLVVDPFIGNTIMVNALTGFKGVRPHVNVLMKVGESNNNLRDIAAGKADFGVLMRTGEATGEKDLCYRELFKDRLILLVGRDSQLARYSAITLMEAMSQPLVLFNTEFSTDCAISSLLRRHGPFNATYRLDSFPMLEKVVSMNQCAAFAPGFMRSYFSRRGNIVPIDIADAELEISMVVSWTRKHHLSLVEKEMIETIASFCCTNEFAG